MHIWAELCLIGRWLCTDSGWELHCLHSRALYPRVGSQSRWAEEQLRKWTQGSLLSMYQITLLCLQSVDIYNLCKFINQLISIWEIYSHPIPSTCDSWDSSWRLKSHINNLFYEKEFFHILDWCKDIFLFWKQHISLQLKIDRLCS